ncbi:hypothetical protein F5X96DRAFT_669530 [Biscogniauxia mediterranea]|nr:hypothetical protein F5X96DRAFT_669530 [Biscogniauxia mediterranea]
MVSPVGTFFIILVVLLVIAAVGWIVFTQLRARRLGLPSPPLSSYNPFARSDPSPYGLPQPAPGGIRGWFSDKLRALRGGGGNTRSAAGAYENPSSASRGRSHSGFGPLDPDEAWDTRVHTEADTYGPGGYYEEQELGYRGGGGGGAYAGSGYEMNLPAEERGRTMSRSPGVGGGGSAHLGAHHPRQNPFDDDAAEPSNLRGVSPRPIVDTTTPAAASTPAATAAATTRKNGHAGESPTSAHAERRSIFREDV